MKQINNPLLAGGHYVELPAHLGEAIVDVRTEVDEVLPLGVETCGGGSAELTDFAFEVPGLHRSSLAAITDDGITSFAATGTD